MVTYLTRCHSFSPSKMHGGSLNLSFCVIAVPNSQKYNSESLKLLMGSREVQITVILVNPLACQAGWTLTLWGPYVRSTSLLPLPSTAMAAWRRCDVPCQRAASGRHGGLCPHPGQPDKAGAHSGVAQARAGAV